MNIDKECEHIENNPNLTQEEKDERIQELEEGAAEHRERYLQERTRLDREYGYDE